MFDCPNPINEQQAKQANFINLELTSFFFRLSYKTHNNGNLRNNLFS